MRKFILVDKEKYDALLSNGLKQNTAIDQSQNELKNLINDNSDDTSEKSILLSMALRKFLDKYNTKRNEPSLVKIVNDANTMNDNPKPIITENPMIEPKIKKAIKRRHSPKQLPTPDPNPIPVAVPQPNTAPKTPVANITSLITPVPKKKPRSKEEKERLIKDEIEKIKDYIRNHPAEFNYDDRDNKFWTSSGTAIDTDPNEIIRRIFDPKVGELSPSGTFVLRNKLLNNPQLASFKTKIWNLRN